MDVQLPRALAASFSRCSGRVVVVCAGDPAGERGPRRPLTVRYFDATSGAEDASAAVLFPDADADDTCCCLSRDGTLFTCTEPNPDDQHWARRRLCIRDTAGRKKTWVPDVAYDSICFISFSNDHEQLMCVQRESVEATLHDCNTGEQVKTFRGGDDYGCHVAGCALSDDGRTLISAVGCQAVLWDVRTEKPLMTAPHDDVLSACAFSPNDKVVITSTRSDMVRLWNAFTGQSLRRLSRYRSEAQQLVFSPCSSMVAAACGTAGMMLWAVQTGEVLRTAQREGAANAALLCGLSLNSTKLLTLWGPEKKAYKKHSYNDDDEDDPLEERRLQVWDVSQERNAIVPAVVRVPRPCLQTDLLSLLRSGEDADVVLKTACGREFKAHRAILRLRSHTLAAQLSGAFADSTRIVSVPADIDAAVVERMLEFMYADELKPKTTAEAAALLHAADYYGVLRLRGIAEAALVAALQPDNVAATLQLASRTNAPALRDAALRYTLRHGAAVTEADGWAALADEPALMLDVVHVLTKRTLPPHMPARKSGDGASGSAAPQPTADTSAAPAADAERRTRPRLE